MNDATRRRMFATAAGVVVAAVVAISLLPDSPRAVRREGPTATPTPIAPVPTAEPATAERALARGVADARGVVAAALDHAQGAASGGAPRVIRARSTPALARRLLAADHRPPAALQQGGRVTEAVAELLDGRLLVYVTVQWRNEGRIVRAVLESSGSRWFVAALR